jgi:hypothetical protein
MWDTLYSTCATASRTIPTIWVSETRGRTESGIDKSQSLIMTQVRSHLTGFSVGPLQFFWKFTPGDNTLSIQKRGPISDSSKGWGIDSTDCSSKGANIHGIMLEIRQPGSNHEVVDIEIYPHLSYANLLSFTASQLQNSRPLIPLSFLRRFQWHLRNGPERSMSDAIRLFVTERSFNHSVQSPKSVVHTLRKDQMVGMSWELFEKWLTTFHKVEYASLMCQMWPMLQLVLIGLFVCKGGRRMVCHVIKMRSQFPSLHISCQLIARIIQWPYEISRYHKNTLWKMIHNLKVIWTE